MLLGTFHLHNIPRWWYYYHIHFTNMENYLLNLVKKNHQRSWRNSMGSRCLLCMQLTLAWSLLSLGTLNIAECNPGGSTKHWWSSSGSSRNYMFQVILYAVALVLNCWTRLRIWKGTQNSRKLTPSYPGSYSRTKCGPFSLSLKLQRGVFYYLIIPRFPWIIFGEQEINKINQTVNSEKDE